MMFQADEEWETTEGQMAVMFEVDDTLDPVTKLENYMEADIDLLRTALVRSIPDAMEQCGKEESCRRILPLLSTFAADSSTGVRSALAGIMLPITEKLLVLGNINPESMEYEQFLDIILPITFELAVDKESVVVDASWSALVDIAKFVLPDDVREHIFDRLVEFSDDEDNEKKRICAGHLLCELASCFEADLLDGEFLSIVRDLAGDSIFGVRKAVARNLHKALIAVKNSETSRASLIEAFELLSSDDIWGVRSACVTIIGDFSACLYEAERKKHLIPALRRLLQDKSRWVRGVAHDNLAPFMVTLTKESDIPHDFIEKFADMAQIEEDFEFPERCAFNMPAMLECVGWENESLRDAYVALKSHKSHKVRRALAFSLKDVISAKGVTADVVSLLRTTFEEFLEDLDDVRVGALTSAVKFIRHAYTSPSEMDAIIATICSITSETWRMRLLITQLIGKLARQCYTTEMVETLMVETIKKYLDDPVYDVRHSAFRSLLKILQVLQETNNGEDVIACIKNMMFEYGGSFQRRQLVILGMRDMLVHMRDFFQKHIAPLLETVASDPVVNLRISLVKFLKECFYSEDVLGILAGDVDRDVRDIAIEGLSRGSFEIAPEAPMWSDEEEEDDDEDEDVSVYDSEEDEGEEDEEDEDEDSFA
eukprot:TRINITY_DN81051_c0_g1_i1.p1 TRINITY_DN81051_c0_g1~~TRINITY_DN81051_c0_g1_i1.p1  ORF type:complete len:654 (-),score=193.05 TRINITY_DN81051_c0_g1_i1:194-2155(-)